MKKAGLALIAAFALGSPMAMAVPFTEIPDAGSLVGSAQDAGTNVTSITGSTGDFIPNTTDTDYVDLFSFGWGGGLLDATLSSGFNNAMLFLFNSDGSFIASDSSNISTILGANDYLLGITGQPNAPTYDSSQHLSGWQPTVEGATPATGSYTVNINSGEVPEPAPLALLALGLTAFGLVRRKRR